MWARYATITNWATFAQVLEVPGCEQQLHLPIFNLSEVPCEMAFIFRATSKDMGVLMLSRKLRDDKLESCALFGASVNSVVFPD